MSSKPNYYEELSKLNVNDHVEKKGKFSYLSWAWAVDVLRKKYPTATWEVMRFDGMPFMETKLGYFVEVAVTVEGITLSQIHPVLDNNNKPIAQPTSFHINTSIQRCLVKAIALHGLGLYIYAGEDLPEDPAAEEARRAEQEAADKKLLEEIKEFWIKAAGTDNGLSEYLAKKESEKTPLAHVHSLLKQKAEGAK